MIHFKRISSTQNETLYISCILFVIGRKWNCYYRPRSEVSDGYVFTGVCHFNSEGGRMSGHNVSPPLNVRSQCPPPLDVRSQCLSPPLWMSGPNVSLPPLWMSGSNVSPPSGCQVPMSPPLWMSGPNVSAPPGCQVTMSPPPTLCTGGRYAVLLECILVVSVTTW